MSRQLPLAILASFFWHVFLFSFVNVVFLPKGFQLNKESVIVFLGPILGDSAITGNEGRKDFVPLPSVAFAYPESAFKQTPPFLAVEEKETLDAEGYIDPDALPGADLSMFVARSARSGVREVIFRPPFSGYPEWEHQQFKAQSVIFRVFVSSQGLVEEVVARQASANPEVDAALARYVRKWRFAPSADLEGQWQIVTLKFDFEDTSVLTVNVEQG